GVDGDADENAINVPQAVLDLLGEVPLALLDQIHPRVPVDAARLVLVADVVRRPVDDDVHAAAVHAADGTGDRVRGGGDHPLVRLLPRVLHLQVDRRAGGDVGLAERPLLGRVNHHAGVAD